MRQFEKYVFTVSSPEEQPQRYLQIRIARPASSSDRSESRRSGMLLAGYSAFHERHGVEQKGIHRMTLSLKKVARVW